MKKIEVYLINGFLGSGKTTTLIQMMQFFKKQQKKYAIILNELGNANVEKHLFKEESFYELLDGCVCCSIKDDLKGTLNELIEMVKKERIDIVLLEGTGVANPSEIIETFHEKKYADFFSILESICIVDGLHIKEYSSVFSSSKEVRRLQKEQIENGSILVLNKTDQLSSDLSMTKAEKIIRKYNATAPIIRTSYGNGVTELLRIKKTVALDESREKEHTSHSHTHHHIKAIKIDDISALTKKELRTFLRENREVLLRAKGTVQNKEDQEWYHFQYASGLFEWERLNHPINKKKGEMVLIGENLSKNIIKW